MFHRSSAHVDSPISLRRPLYHKPSAAANLRTLQNVGVEMPIESGRVALLRDRHRHEPAPSRREADGDPVRARAAALPRRSRRASPRSRLRAFPLHHRRCHLRLLHRRGRLQPLRRQSAPPRQRRKDHSTGLAVILPVGTGRVHRRYQRSLVKWHGQPESNRHLWIWSPGHSLYTMSVIGLGGGTRTCNRRINSAMHYHCATPK